MAFPGAPVPVNEIPKDKSFPLPNSIDQEVSLEGVQVFSVLPVDPRRLDFPATGTMMEFDQVALPWISKKATWSRKENSRSKGWQ
ncbi:uncharacterized protein LOC122237425 isoform X4 [Panthera tigris]|uniref:uncharacterized protein LOC122237425 isoform X4 n=1 Tax=Panthera tigris TaxID=9694 RepID=UPI001C6FC317|nr:uncharacterized protein LOC122237425 isoform X4 [Panthera tigris]